MLHVLIFLFALTAGCGPVAEPLNFQYTTQEIDVSELPDYAAEQLYRSAFATVKPDSVLRVLLVGRMPVDEAWEAIEDQCAAAGDPVGPRFTVVLQDPEPIMTTFDFEQGNGLRPCTTRVRRYLIARIR